MLAEVEEEQNIYVEKIVADVVDEMHT